MKKKIVIWVIILAVVGGVIGLRIASKNKMKYTNVKTTTVSNGDVKSYLSTTATIKSKNSKDYYSLSGKITGVNVKVGDTVAKGQVLVTYDTPDLNASVKQAQIQYDNAVIAKQILINNNNDINSKIADLNNQIASIDSQISVLQSSRIPDTAAISTLQAKEATLKQSRDALKPISDEQFKQADNSISLAQIALDTAKTNLSKNSSSIASDISGVVTAVNAVQGAMGSPAMVAVTVQDLSSLQGIVSVGKYDAAKLAVGQDAIIKTPSNQYKGKISFIDPAAKQTISASGSDSSLNVYIDVLDQASDLRVGFDTDVDILLGQVNGVIKIPVECIRTDKSDKNYVYVVNDNKVSEREVKLGLLSDLDAQILSGVSEGDKVILNPSTSIHDGSLVKETIGVGK